MNKLLLSAPFALALAMAAAPASANQGTIFFAGEIRAGTCPVEIIDPISGAVGATVPLGVALPADFPTLGTESNERRFGLRVPSGCITADGEVTVSFVSSEGPAGAANDLYALRSGASSAGGLALVIKDQRSKAIIAHGATSDPYEIVNGQPVDMQFLAAYKSTAATVTPGAINADVNFTIDIQ